ncbi:DUF6301 family protein [Nocardia sp. AG03]|uniref:DUF6301 family protein n=1 Tax=Nocardia sp. AG03 TaxID=3025312 RepID=UPI00241817ED|nr:DUF6301 family protein [Nocardia sp. AG03]
MRVDIDRAAQVVRVAAEFDWSWTADDLPAFSERVGWHLDRLDTRWPSLNTNLDVNRTDTMLNVGSAAQPGGPRQLKQIAFSVTDVVVDGPSVEPALNGVFDDLWQAVFEVVGKRPTGWWIVPSRGLRWDLPSVVVTVTMSARSVYVRLVSPAYQRWNDENDQSLEDDE